MHWRTVVSMTLSTAAIVVGVIAVWPQATPVASFNTVPADAQLLIVRTVLSGDTVELVAGTPGAQLPRWGTVTARLIGVNAPNFGITDECYAAEAQGRLAKWLPRGTVAWVSTDTTKRDANGRWLTYIWTADGRLVNQLLVSDGFARTADPGENLRLWPEIERAGAQAASRFAGLWLDCR